MRPHVDEPACSPLLSDRDKRRLWRAFHDPARDARYRIGERTGWLRIEQEPKAAIAAGGRR